MAAALAGAPSVPHFAPGASAPYAEQRTPEVGGGTRAVQRQRVRAVPRPEFPDRPGRSALAGLLRAEQNLLGMTQEQYGAHYGVSRWTVSRFMQGSGKLTPLFRLNLRAEHPDWTPTINAVVQEDARRAEAAEARRGRT